MSEPCPTCGHSVHSVNRVLAGLSRVRLWYSIGIPLLIILFTPSSVGGLAFIVGGLLVTLRLTRHLRRVPWRKVGKALSPLSEPA